MSQNNETPAEKTSILTNAMLRAKNKLTLTTVPNEDANEPKKTIKPMVAFIAGASVVAAVTLTMFKVVATKVEDEIDSDEDSTLDD